MDRDKARQMKESFTLIELLIVIVIVALLSSLGLPVYMGTIEKSYNKEARSMIRMILEAEKMEKLKRDKFVACSDTSSCSSELNLSLPYDRWQYSVKLNPNTIIAERMTKSRTFKLENFDVSTATDTIPNCSGKEYCPSTK